MSGSACDVCDGPTLIVASSALGAISFAYCSRCAATGAEPYWMLVTTIALCGGIDQVAEHVTACIQPTLEIAGKTEGQFRADVMESMAEMADEPPGNEDA